MARRARTAVPRTRHSIKDVEICSFLRHYRWGPSQLVHGNSTDNVWTTVGDANLVQDRSTGTIWLLHTRNNSRLFSSSSGDEGATWSEPKDITAAAKLGYPSQGWIGTGHAGGLQLDRGPTAGRLIVPAYTSASYAIYSDDRGASWRAGKPITSGAAAGNNTPGECQIAETGAHATDGAATPPPLFHSPHPNIPHGRTDVFQARQFCSFQCV